MTNLKFQDLQRERELDQVEMEAVRGGAPWFIWMAVGAAGAIVLDSHTDVIGEAGHGCRGLDCNNLP